MGLFRFKQFSVANVRSAMKVNTDGVLLGAVADVLPSDREVLDIGTGTGVVALMVAQRLSAVAPEYHVQGIDIDAPSAEEAGENFRNSPWAGHLDAEHVSLALHDRNTLQGGEQVMYDLIVSNPPYYDNSLETPERRRNTARHTGDGSSASLSYREILEYASGHLRQEGRLAMILPADQEKALLRYARMCRFHLWKIMRVRTLERKPAARILVQFKLEGPDGRHGKDDAVAEELVLTDKEGKRTSQHASLVTDYLL